MTRSTKIVATIGPASSTLDMLTRMIAAGVDVVRLNFSHGTAQDHIDRAALVREAAAACGREVAIMADLQGPKIRVGKFENGKITLAPGDPFVLDATCPLGNQERVGLDYQDLPRDVGPGDVLLLNDGLIVLVVDRVIGSEIFTTVRVGGELSNNKGINRQGGGLVGAGADRQGHGGHQDRHGPRRGLRGRVASRRTPPTWKWRASWPPWPASRTASRRA